MKKQKEIIMPVGSGLEFQPTKISKTKSKMQFKGEDALHRDCVEWFYTQFGDFTRDKSAPMIHHSPNVNANVGKIQAINYNRKMQILGRLKGFPDLMIRRQDGAVIFIELKIASKKGKFDYSSDEQRYIVDYLGKSCFVASNQNDFEKIVKEFLGYKDGIDLLNESV